MIWSLVLLCIYISNHLTRKECNVIVMAHCFDTCNVICLRRIFLMILYSCARATYVVVHQAACINVSSSLVLTSSGVPSSAYPSETAVPTPTTESPLQRHLSLIIGVPTGVGLSVIGLSACLIWLACLSYCEYRKSLPQQGNNGSGATRSTKMQVHVGFNLYTLDITMTVLYGNST